MLLLLLQFYNCFQTLSTEISHQRVLEGSVTALASPQKRKTTPCQSSSFPATSLVSIVSVLLALLLR